MVLINVSHPCTLMPMSCSPSLFVTLQQCLAASCPCLVPSCQIISIYNCTPIGRMGYPLSRPGMGYPPSAPGMGYPSPPGKCGQTNYYLPSSFGCGQLKYTAVTNQLNFHTD